MDYLILLRGINVGGNHRVPMADLRDYLTAAGFDHVRSYINSGNLFITSDLPRETCAAVVNQLLADHFPFPIASQVLARPDFMADLALAPTWWGADPLLRHNALFKLPGYEADFDDWLRAGVTADYDQVLLTPNVIFWTSTLKVHFSRSFYSKIVGTPFYQHTSARNYNTTMKLKQLLEASYD
ncbi:DUF1697 domain-containing protein [Levilactobacillus cerevisiae]|uniref:DUF1697 domain-containing protein n=1 Tax=Levilactobacillus cerevisiae TaxID=1704076 RepID=UPI000F795FF2|nr:DUF1697 domain-containing protein [Levilactobacillus cerevisiae]